MKLPPLFAWLVLLPGPLSVQGSGASAHLYSGKVLAPDRQPVALATVQMRVNGRSVRVLTRQDGTFRVRWAR